VDVFKLIIDWLMARIRDIKGLVYVSAGFMITLAALFCIILRGRREKID
jgi:hypothetical protein